MNNQQLTTAVLLRIPATIKQQLTNSATNNHRSLNKEILHALTEYLAAQRNK